MGLDTWAGAGGYSNLGVALFTRETEAEGADECGR